ncbi:hypothetical protein B0H13DRAFT_1949951 [Mycena leptocephala]|nr:hypothetical protein B0H13DRAFT_1949951 [Mycena leptocephala]
MSFRRFAGLAMATICFLAVYHIQQGDLRSRPESFTTVGYRDHLAFLRPTDGQPHSRTLGAGRIYVIRLPSRTKQQEDMWRLASALDIDLTWHNGTDSRDENVLTIIERLRWWRDTHTAEKKHDFSRFTFEWSNDIRQETGSLELKSADLWTQPLTMSGLPELPPLPVPDNRPPLYAVYGEDVYVPDRIHSESVAHWKSHYDVLRQIAEGAEEVALVFEDDVDVEWELETRLNRFLPALPPDWDVLLLGHCSATETLHAPISSSPFIHPSNMPHCTPGYAVTRRGAQRLVRRLRTEAFAFSRPLERAFAHLIEAQRMHDRRPGTGPSLNPGMRFFSVYPPVVVQRYTLEKNTQGEEVERLEDSTRERIALEEQMHIPNT